jgi:23S rRNA (uracil1939-C5)-methyltransferase
VEGRVVFAPFLLPGELARVEPHSERGSVLRVTPVEILEPSEHRAVPPCPYFMKCGGCHYQHATYEQQVEWKRDILREQLQRVGKIAFEGEIALVTGEPLGYRNRTQFHVRGTSIGYLEQGSKKLVPVDHCPISSPAINAALRALLDMTKDRRFPKFLKEIELFTNESETVFNALDTERPLARSFFEWAAERIPGANSGVLEYAAAGEKFRVGHKSFFQVNRFLVDRLVTLVVGDAEGEEALDLYAGAGLFSLPLARRFRSVTAVESDASGIHDLGFNAERAGLKVRAVFSRTEDYLKNAEGAPDLVIADPPRSGLGKIAVHHLLRLQPRSLVLVGCDPATLARDLGALIAGGYRLDRLAMVDLFPQTYHIEAVAHLSR